MKVHSEEQNTWYTKVIWKKQYKSADAKINYARLSILLPSVHSKTFTTEAFFKIINRLRQCYQFCCFLCVVLFIFFLKNEEYLSFRV